MKHNETYIFSNDDLHAYVDGQLSPEHITQFENYLQNHPELIEEISNYRHINKMLQATGNLFPADNSENVVQLPTHTKPRKQFFRLPIAAAVPWIIFGLLIGWTSHGLSSVDSTNFVQFAEKTSATYSVYSPEKLHPVEVSSNDSEHLSAWLSNRMDMEFQIPDLDDLGFTLVGGRLMVGDASPAAMLMYEDNQGQRVILYVRNDLDAIRKTKMKYIHNNNKANVVAWSDGTVSFGFAGNFSEQELRPAAQRIKVQFSL